MRYRFFSSSMLLLCAALLSCSKVPETAPTGPDGHQKLPDDQVFWSIVGKLVGMDQMTPDYEGKTFTPTIGEEIEPGIRVVSVNSLMAAVERYNTLTGASIDVDTESFSWNNPLIGTLGWNKGDGTTAWGTVDVSVPSVPSLTRIIYRSPEQGDTNGGVEGGSRAYYRFGDVIARQRPADSKGGVEFPAITEYWVCVRPAFHHEGKGQSHWVSLSPLPRENVWPYYDDDYNFGPFTASNGMNYSLPYNLRDDTEWMQDFAELLYAIHQPVSWSNNIDNNYSEGWFGPKGQLMFHDFHKDKKDYHSIGFWDNVRRGWEEKEVYSKVFGKPQSYFSQITSSGGAGLYCLYYGYSWWTWFENSVTLYQAHFSPDSRDLTKRNIYTATYSKVSHQVVEPDDPHPGADNFPLDFYAARSYEQPYFVKTKFRVGQSPPGKPSGSVNAKCLIDIDI